eukprot:SAG11_NODE_13342_length_659_cov_1.014286_1_plen_76_part_00
MDADGQPYPADRFFLYEHDIVPTHAEFWYEECFLRLRCGFGAFRLCYCLKAHLLSYAHAAISIQATDTGLYPIAT